MRFWTLDMESDIERSKVESALNNWSKIPVTLEEDGEREGCLLGELNSEFPDDIETMQSGKRGKADLLVHRILSVLTNSFSKVSTASLDEGKGMGRASVPALDLPTSGDPLKVHEEHQKVEDVGVTIDLDRAREIQEEISS